MNAAERDLTSYTESLLDQIAGIETGRDRTSIEAYGDWAEYLSEDG